MTEVEWLACNDPQKMLGFLRSGWRRWLPWRSRPICKTSERSLRLFACACFRSQMAHSDGRTDQSLAAVAAVERWLDGQASWQDLRKARPHCWITPPERAWPAAAGAAWYDAFTVSWDAASRYLSAATAAPIRQWEAAGQAGADARRRVQSVLLRCIFGPSLFRPVTTLPAWRTAQVVALAQVAYDRRELPAGHLDPLRLAVLADALEEAGCTSSDILGHLRGPGPHVRGCHVLDLLLGKGA